MSEIGASAHITGECIYCENTTADFTVMPRDEHTALRVRCEGCGAVTELRRAGDDE